MFKEIVDDAQRTTHDGRWMLDIGRSQKFTMSTLCSGELKILCELQESMERCTGCRDITEILLKMALNTIQSFNGNQHFSPLPTMFSILPKTNLKFLFTFMLSSANAFNLD